MGDEDEAITRARIIAHSCAEAMMRSATDFAEQRDLSDRDAVAVMLTAANELVAEIIRKVLKPAYWASAADTHAEIVKAMLDETRPEGDPASFEEKPDGVPPARN